MNTQILENCDLCPRNCGINRTLGNRGYCRQNDKIKVARAALHMWEEPCISGDRGSGTVFFSGCSLGCVYCQNHNIANGNAGKEISVERLSEIFLELQDKGAHNINLVTAGHFIPQLIESIIKAKKNGLKLPIVYNTSSYEKTEAVKMLDGLIDIYLPDLKYMNNNIAMKYSNCKDYFYYASNAIEEMVRQADDCEFNEDGLMIRGVIVRHLTLPGYLNDSKNILKYLYDKYKNKIYISIMNQYTPLQHVEKYPEINRKITDEEYEDLINYAVNLGIENGFIQEGETASESFIPDFNEEGV